MSCDSYYTLVNSTTLEECLAYSRFLILVTIIVTAATTTITIMTLILEFHFRALSHETREKNFLIFFLLIFQTSLLKNAVPASLYGKDVLQRLSVLPDNWLGKDNFFPGPITMRNFQHRLNVRYYN